MISLSWCTNSIWNFHKVESLESNQINCCNIVFTAMWTKAWNIKRSNERTLCISIHMKFAINFLLLCGKAYKKNKYCHSAIRSFIPTHFDTYSSPDVAQIYAVHWMAVVIFNDAFVCLVSGFIRIILWFIVLRWYGLDFTEMKW